MNENNEHILNILNKYVYYNKNKSQNSLYIYYVIFINNFVQLFLWQNSFINLLLSIESNIS